ncbi:MAG: MBL fold metallo-hydrolase [Roseburia sp.]|nr:MBL fold metallo-hydrolase [Roseburia sp.]MCM1096620.1 MBL fold metallo-hydrolase [Ruminococcus flavefaciens]
MEITYLYHSGFLAETKDCYYLFDYYRGELPCLNPEKPILVFVSHFHGDHYNPAVFQQLKERGMKSIAGILANDIKKKKYPEGFPPLEAENDQNPNLQGCEDMDALKGHILKACHSREYILPFQTRIRTLLSTDSGVAYLLSCPEGTFFHAGDLNDWLEEEMTEAERRQMTGSYRAALRPLTGLSLDAACLPLDPHLGSHYADGMLYFLKTVNVKQVWPMHFWDRPEIIDQFIREHPEYAAVLRRP